MIIDLSLWASQITGLGGRGGGTREETRAIRSRVNASDYIRATHNGVTRAYTHAISEIKPETVVRGLERRFVLLRNRDRTPARKRDVLLVCFRIVYTQDLLRCDCAEFHLLEVKITLQPPHLSLSLYYSLN